MSVKQQVILNHFGSCAAEIAPTSKFKKTKT